MRHRATQAFWKAYHALPDPIRKMADHSFALLKSDPRHPSLHLKQAGRYWSVRIGISWRALAIREGDEMIWFWIGSHADYDRLLQNR